MNASAFTMEVSFDHGNKVAYINREGLMGMTYPCKSFKEQVDALKELRKNFQIVVPVGSDLAEVAGFRTEAKQRRRKSDRQRLVDRIARLVCGLPWDVSKQYSFRGASRANWNAAKKEIDRGSTENLKKLEGHIAVRLQAKATVTLEECERFLDLANSRSARQMDEEIREAIANPIAVGAV